jgi:hypothetical protein
MIKLIDLISEERRRRSGLDDERVVVTDGLPPITRVGLAQILREIGEKGRGLPQIKEARNEQAD